MNIGGQIKRPLHPPSKVMRAIQDEYKDWHAEYSGSGLVRQISWFHSGGGCIHDVIFLRRPVQGASVIVLDGDYAIGYRSLREWLDWCVDGEDPTRHNITTDIDGPARKNTINGLFWITDVKQSGEAAVLTLVDGKKFIIDSTGFTVAGKGKSRHSVPHEG